MSMSLTMFVEPTILLAQQTQYTMAYALIIAIVFLGYLVVAIPRPRKTAYGSDEEERQAKKNLEKQKVRAKNQKNRKKREKQRKKARKKNLKK